MSAEHINQINPHPTENKNAASGTESADNLTLARDLLVVARSGNTLDKFEVGSISAVLSKSCRRILNGKEEKTFFWFNKNTTVHLSRSENPLDPDTYRIKRSNPFNPNSALVSFSLNGEIIELNTPIETGKSDAGAEVGNAAGETVITQDRKDKAEQVRNLAGELLWCLCEADPKVSGKFSHKLLKIARDE
jgi:hypothetical protein